MDCAWPLASGPTRARGEATRPADCSPSCAGCGSGLLNDIRSSMNATSFFSDFVPVTAVTWMTQHGRRWAGWRRRKRKTKRRTRRSSWPYRRAGQLAESAAGDGGAQHRQQLVGSRQRQRVRRPTRTVSTANPCGATIQLADDPSSFVGVDPRGVPDTATASHRGSRLDPRKRLILSPIHTSGRVRSIGRKLAIATCCGRNEMVMVTIVIAWNR
jgi:hypothetical protein